MYLVRQVLGSGKVKLAGIARAGERIVSLQKNFVNMYLRGCITINFFQNKFERESKYIYLVPEARFFFGALPKM